MKRLKILSLLISCSVLLTACGVQSPQTVLLQDSTEQSASNQLFDENNSSDLISDESRNSILTDLNNANRYADSSSVSDDSSEHSSTNKSTEYDESGVSDSTKLSGKLSNSINLGTGAKFGQTIGNSSVFNPDGAGSGDLSSVNKDNTVSASDSKLASYSSKSIEFVSFPQQTLTRTSRSMILTNLSSNSGIAAMKFTIVYKDKTVYSSDYVMPGDSAMISAKSIVGDELDAIIADKTAVTISILSQAYGIVNVDGIDTVTETPLNSIVQDVSVSIADDSAEQVSSTSYDNQADGLTYTTKIAYSANNLELSTVLPAVIAVNSGNKGTEIYATFKATNTSDKTSVTLTATGDDGNSNITLEGSSEPVTAYMSGTSDSDKALLTYKFTKANTLTQRVGPIYCTLNNGSTAVSNYYGTIQFSLNLKQS